MAPRVIKLFSVYNSTISFGVEIVIKGIGILLYRGNLNKCKIYIRRIYITDRKSVLERDEKSE